MRLFDMQANRHFSDFADVQGHQAGKRPAASDTGPEGPAAEAERSWSVPYH